MSRIFGPIRQLGYVVPDVEKEMKRWVTLGVGPWFYYQQFAVPEFCYNGIRKHTAIDLSVAFANSGDLQIELINQRDDTPSMFKEFVGEGKEGMQHWAAWPENYNEAYEQALKMGLIIGQEGRTTRGRFAYFRAHPRSSEAIELSEASDDIKKFRSMVRDAAVVWDGANPIRRL